MIVFLHLHKCGGSTINYILSQHKKNYPNSRNGNPWTEKGIIKFWNFNKIRFERFMEKCKGLNVEYINLEWNYFTNYDSLNLSEIKQVICIRDPYERYKSVLKHDEYNHNIKNYSEYKNFNLIWERPNSTLQKFNINYNKDNYYVSMLNGFGNKHHVQLTKEHLDIAKSRLAKFDAIIILENSDSFKLLNNLGINNYDYQKRNQSSSTDPINMDTFEKNNVLDRKLYNYAVKLSSNMLESIKKINIGKDLNIDIGQDKNIGKHLSKDLSKDPSKDLDKYLGIDIEKDIGYYQNNQKRNTSTSILSPNRTNTYYYDDVFFEIEKRDRPKFYTNNIDNNTKQNKRDFKYENRNYKNKNKKHNDLNREREKGDNELEKDDYNNSKDNDNKNDDYDFKKSLLTSMNRF